MTVTRLAMQEIDIDPPTTKYWSDLLLRVATTRSESAFAELHQHFSPLIRGFLQAQAGYMSAESLDEIAQEVMMKVWFKADKFDVSKAAASTWIFTLARNARIDFIRKHARHDNNTQSLEPDILETEDIWDEDDFNQPFINLARVRTEIQVRDLLKEIPSEQRQCLQKVYMEGKSHTEIAGELDLPLGTVKSRVRLGLKRLQSSFAEQRG